MIIPLLGYAPDADQTARGVIVNCSNLIPTLKGMKGAPSAASTGISALAAACLGAASLRDLSNAIRTFAGTATALYESSSASWTDRTRVSGGAYTLGTSDRWRFAQYGNVALAAAQGQTLQASSSGAFADVTGAPAAEGVETVGQFVFLWATFEGTYSTSPNRWWCSALGDYTDWTPAIATQSATNTLVSSPGKIVGMRRFGEDIIAYKQRSMYRGTYFGPPVIWGFEQIPGVIGALTHEAVVNIGTTENPRHLFMGDSDFYSFDGSVPTPIGINRVTQTVFAEINRQKLNLVMAVHDPVNFTVTWRYCTTSNNTVDKAVVYNYRSDKWGRDDVTAEFAFEYIATDITYSDLGTYYSTYADFPTSPYGTAFIANAAPVPAIFDGSHLLKSMNGATSDSSFTTGDFGDDVSLAMLQRVQPRYLTAPTTASMVNYHRQNLGDGLTTDATTSISNGRFDVYRSARWHRFRFDQTGNNEVTALDLQVQRDGND